MEGAWGGCGVSRDFLELELALSKSGHRKFAILFFDLNSGERDAEEFAGYSGCSRAHERVHHGIGTEPLAQPTHVL